MAGPTQVPKAVNPPINDEPLSNLVRQLASDGARWADAELLLARVEGGAALRNIAAGIICAAIGLALTITASVIMAQAAVAALAPHLHGPAYAGLAVGLAILAVVAVAAFAARHLLLRRPQAVGMIFKWLVGPP
jgi:Putative Actinobacterial Holin-X, holin superfamily III